MPELPETETLARDLNGSLVGRVIAGVETPHGDVLRGITSRSISRKLTGRTFRRAWRRAKAVVLDLDDALHVVVVPRFTGGLLLRGPSLPDDAYDAVKVRLKDGATLAYRDVRRLGTLSVFDSDEFSTFDRRLGKEPLDPAFTPGELSALLRTSSRSVKALLMDQSRIAGVGNIYSNEALWASRIDPSREARSITLEEAGRLRDALVSILLRSIDARGTTFRDYRDAQGNPGEFVRQLAAYGRGGQPCLRCGTRLTMTHAIDGRATVFCHRCQS